MSARTRCPAAEHRTVFPLVTFLIGSNPQRRGSNRLCGSSHVQSMGRRSWSGGRSVAISARAVFGRGELGRTSAKLGSMTTRMLCSLGFSQWRTVLVRWSQMCGISITTGRRHFSDEISFSGGMKLLPANRLGLSVERFVARTACHNMSYVQNPCARISCVHSRRMPSFALSHLHSPNESRSTLC